MKPQIVAELVNYRNRMLPFMPGRRTGTVIKLDCEMSEAEVAAHRALLKNLASDSRPSKFLSTLQRFVLLYQHPGLLADRAEDLSADELVRQSPKLRVMIAKLHEIRARREKVIVFCPTQERAGHSREGTSAGIPASSKDHQRRDKTESGGWPEFIRHEDAQRDSVGLSD